MFDLTGKVALVTGAGQGVGAGIAEALASQGATVAVNDLFADRATEVAERIGGRVEAFDVTDHDAVVAAVQRIGTIDILVNNAGIPTTGTMQTAFVDTTPDDWRRLVDLNLFGVIHCTHAVLPGMCERGWGRVITISSEAGRFGLPIHVSLYGAAKAGAVGLMKHLAHEVGPSGVTCNALALGSMNNIPDRGQNARHPRPRAGTPADIGAAVVYLASDEADWVTGQVFPVNGGAFT